MQTMEIPTYICIDEFVKPITVPRSSFYDGSLAEYAIKFNVSKICFRKKQKYSSGYLYDDHDDCYSCTSNGKLWKPDDESLSEAPLATLLRDKVLKEDKIKRDKEAAAAKHNMEREQAYKYLDQLEASLKNK